MKRKKIAKYILVLSFYIIVCFSRFAYWIFEEISEKENYENRNLATKPILTIENYASYPEEYNLYINDNIQFRNELITLNSMVDYKIFDRSTSPDVVIGKNGFLFYSKIEDGDPIGTYKGENLYSEEELEMIAQNCVHQKDYLSSLGKEFVLFIAPNKERVYSEYMPSNIGAPATEYKVLQVYNYLKNNTDIRVVYCYEDLMKAKEECDVNLWYKTDTHWNMVGGYVGARSLMNELGILIPAIGDDNVQIVKGPEMSGDLAGLLHLKEQLVNTDNIYSIAWNGYCDVETLAYDFNETYVFHTNNKDARKLYVIRDSFSMALADYMKCYFNDSYWRYVMTYSYEDFVEQDPDIVVYEVVERGIDRLKDFSIQ